MPRAKATKATKAPADNSKAYRHTRTGAIRLSSSPLGYPYEEAPKAEQPKAEGE